MSTNVSNGDFGFLLRVELDEYLVQQLREEERRRDAAYELNRKHRHYENQIQDYLDADKRGKWWQFSFVNYSWGHYFFETKKDDGVTITDCRRVHAPFLHERRKGFPGHYYYSTCDKYCLHCGGTMPGCGRTEQAKTRSEAKTAVEASKTASESKACCQSQDYYQSWEKLKLLLKPKQGRQSKAAKTKTAKAKAVKTKAVKAKASKAKVVKAKASKAKASKAKAVKKKASKAKAVKTKAVKGKAVKTK